MQGITLACGDLRVVPVGYIPFALSNCCCVRGVAHLVQRAAFDEPPQAPDGVSSQHRVAPDG